MAASRATPAHDALGRAEIVDAAMRRIADGGLDRLTMRALAIDLGVTPMAVYHHVPNKDALLQLVADAVIADVDVPLAEIGSWDLRLAKLARELRSRLAAFPGIGPYLLGSDIVSPAADRIVAAAIAMLVDAGFSERDANLAFTAVHNYVLGRLYVEASLRGPRLRRLRGKRAGAPPAPIAILPADDHFEYGLDHLMRGLRP
jgi:AcrR family transcriptional regulator